MRTANTRKFRGGVPSIKKAFTLVEMLIVVVIIGILVAAILPRITGYLAKTRDMKRQVDLRNVAAAVQMWKDYHGNFPFLSVPPRKRDELKYAGGLNRIDAGIKQYIRELPRDPSGFSVKGFITTIANHRRIFVDQQQGLEPGEYFYQLGCKNPCDRTSQIADFALLVAKVETPEAANYVIVGDRADPLTNPASDLGYPVWFANHFPSYGMHMSVEQNNRLRTCDVLEKAASPAMELVDGKVICRYSDPDQLYYIMKVE